jgi:hypothetical protein
MAEQKRSSVDVVDDNDGSRRQVRCVVGGLTGQLSPLPPHSTLITNKSLRHGPNLLIDFLANDFLGSIFPPMKFMGRRPKNEK